MSPPRLEDPVTKSEAGVSPHEARDRHRHDVITRSLLVGALLCAIFAPFDFFLTGYWVDATVEALGAAVLLALGVFLRRGGDRLVAALIGHIIGGAVILTVVLGGKAQDAVFSWAVLFPVLPFFVLGQRLGLLVSIVFATTATVAVTILAVLDGAQGFSWIAPFNLAGALAGCTVLAYFYEGTRAKAARQLETLAKSDPLTGLANRRGLLDAFAAAVLTRSRAPHRLSLLVLDLDHFKRINDRYGHEAGDGVLCHVAHVIKGMLRANDLIARIGGEEFALLLPDTDLAGAREVAEKIRKAIESTALISPGGSLSVTVSIGVAELDPQYPDFAALFSSADHRLYQAKKAGRNRVTAAT
ncbi:GGDEF domain-containing protein [Rhodospirillum rubrum]|uniref:GGDEF domain-containing protein n=1 Tax=Rhodospirillum rubrum TaxID=1085 RepID=UPI00190675FA|nr:GGDEF domain-containing protein [Rhodospirillum rubrum]MBK1665508.1 GGDEF domain-containing protein [Rhodospirillum rubrum]MBK1677547.1 GGDEF domain-containing protein [Rhodospirillum rubrum]